MSDTLTWMLITEQTVTPLNTPSLSLPPFLSLTPPPLSPHLPFSPSLPRSPRSAIARRPSLAVGGNRSAGQPQDSGQHVYTYLLAQLGGVYWFKTMFLCLAGRLSAARTGKSATAFLAQTSTANRPSDATLTLHNNNNSTFQGRRCFGVSGGGVGSTRLWKRTLRDQDSSAFVTRDRTHWDRVTAVAPGLSAPAQCADYLALIRQPAVRVKGRNKSTEEPIGNVLFSGSWRVPSPRCSAWTMQTRASSTKRGDTGDDKGVIVTLWVEFT